MTSLSSRRTLLILVVALAALNLSAASVLAAPCSLTAADINAYLQGKNSPLAGSGAAFVQRGLEGNVDPRLIVPMRGAETPFRRHIRVNFISRDCCCGGRPRQAVVSGDTTSTP